MPTQFNDHVTGDTVVDILEVMKEMQPDLLDQKSLDHGFVRIIDVMPRLVPIATLNCDFALADAARISYQKGTRKVSSDAGLVDHLVRNRHTSPVEMAELKFHLRMPIFTMRQLVRHRTASLNEESARYSELASDFYVPEPEHWATNTTSNKQATQQGSFTLDQARMLHAALAEHNERSYGLYQALLFDGVNQQDFAAKGPYTDNESYNSMLDEIALKVPGLSREQARMVLGVNIYTQCIYKIDLKNLLHLISLRCDDHAQFEIRELANPMREVVKFLFPATWASFEDHFVRGINFGESELGLVRLITPNGPADWAGSAPIVYLQRLGWTVRRLEEFTKKLSRSALLPASTIANLVTAYKAGKDT